MPTFDGPNLLITLDSGVTEVNVEADLYSEWKEWKLLSDNAKYPDAFRTIGGDPLTPGIEAGAYFFLQNDIGWRIKPPEEDITVYLSGNLAPEDSSLPSVIPTDGPFTDAILGLQPVTQGVSEVLVQLQETAYNGEVWIDTLNGSAGTTFPAGTASSPVSTLGDAMTIANEYGLKTLRVVGNITLDRSFQYWTIIGGAASSSVDLNGQVLDGTIIQRVEVVGAATFTSANDRIVLEECYLTPTGVSGIRGIVIHSYLFGEVVLDGDCQFNECLSGVAGTATPSINADNTDGIQVSIRSYTGGLKLTNFGNAGSNVSVDINSGHLVLDPTVTDGVIVVRGVGHITDNSTGTPTIVTAGFVDGGAVSEAAKVTTNKVVTDPIAGTITVYADDDTTVLFTANMFEDAAGTQQYRGQGAERRERLT